LRIELKTTLSSEESVGIARFLAASPHAHIWQNPNSLPIYLYDGRTAFHFVATERDDILSYGVFYVDRYKREAFCLRGPVFETVQVGRSCIEFLLTEFCRLGVGQLRISPYWAGADAHALAEILKSCRLRPYYRGTDAFTKTGRVWLQGTHKELYGRFSPHTRRDLRRCIKVGFEIIRIRDHERATEAYLLQEKLKERRVLSSLPRREFGELRDRVLFSDHLGAILNAYIAGRLVGTFWVARANDSVALAVGYAIDNEFMRASYRSYRIGAPLWVEGMKWAKDEGCEWFDVEGYDENATQTSPMYGVYKFKGQFRPQPIDIVAEHVGVCHWPKYASYQMSHSWRRLLNVRRKLLAGRLKIRL